METLMAGVALPGQTLVGVGPPPGSSTPQAGQPRASPHLHTGLHMAARLALLRDRLVGLPHEGGDLRQDGGRAQQEDGRTAAAVRVHGGLVQEVFLLVLQEDISLSHLVLNQLQGREDQDHWSGLAQPGHRVRGFFKSLNLI